MFKSMTLHQKVKIKVIQIIKINLISFSITPYNFKCTSILPMHFIEYKWYIKRFTFWYNITIFLEDFAHTHNPFTGLVNGIVYYIFMEYKWYIL